MVLCMAWLQFLFDSVVYKGTTAEPIRVAKDCHHCYIQDGRGVMSCTSLGGTKVMSGFVPEVLDEFEVEGPNGLVPVNTFTY
jgi:hypothetical protein